jgi:hypothetical protein
MTEPTKSRFATLPEPVDLDDTIATHDTQAPPDPESGRDTDRDFLLRYAL